MKSITAAKSEERGLGELLTGLDVKDIPPPPDRSIVPVPTVIANESKRLRGEGKYQQALTLLEKNIWGRIS